MAEGKEAQPDPWEDVPEWMKEGVERIGASVAELERERFRQATEAFLSMPEEEWQEAVRGRPAAAEKNRRSRTGVEHNGNVGRG